MNKKGQLEIGITMMILLVFLILLIISLIVYFQFTYQGIKETRQEILDEKFSTLVNTITGLPELKCSTRGAERECLDAERLVAFGKVVNNVANINTYRGIKDNYLEEFGVNRLDVEVVYPDVGVGDCNQGEYRESCENFNLISFKNTGLKYTTPVSVYYPDENKYKIGKLIVTAEIN
ncbi:MAG: hypothetical protein CMH64_02180 [Nanoarchaeota archaeon]|nr:hypothetical protein [Nanoarchaeota archaeon]